MKYLLKSILFIYLVINLCIFIVGIFDKGIEIKESKFISRTTCKYIAKIEYAFPGHLLGCLAGDKIWFKVKNQKVMIII